MPEFGASQFEASQQYDYTTSLTMAPLRATTMKAQPDNTSRPKTLEKIKHDDLGRKEWTYELSKDVAFGRMVDISFTTWTLFEVERKVRLDKTCM